MVDTCTCLHIQCISSPMSPVGSGELKICILVVKMYYLVLLNLQSFVYNKRTQNVYTT